MKGIGRQEGGLYVINPSTPATSFPFKCMTTAVSASVSHLWHQRLGHAPISVLKKIPVITRLLDDVGHCHYPVCPLARQTRLPFPVSISKTSAVFDLVHADI